MRSTLPEKEMTLRAVVIGVLVGLVFGAANAYVGLRVGMTVSASIPAAIVGMAVLRALKAPTSSRATSSKRLALRESACSRSNLHVSRALYMGD